MVSFKSMRNGAAVLAFVCTQAAPMLAQTAEEPKARPGIQASTLLESGFAIVAMQHLETSIVVTLQRANRAFLCELGLDGKTLHCVEIK